MQISSCMRCLFNSRVELLQVEQEMSKYGVVAASSKDFIDVRGCRIENERRNVLFSMVFNKAAVTNGELTMFGTLSLHYVSAHLLGCSSRAHHTNL